jgi:lysophospholipase L1-like esterase
VRLRLALILVGLAMCAPIGCSSSRGSVSAPAVTIPSGWATQGRPLTVVGDSLSVLARTPIRGALGDAGWDVLIDAFPGRTTADQIPALTYAAADARRAVIIELGTNDAIQVTKGQLDQDAVLATIGQALDLFPERCVVWVVPGRDPEATGSRVGEVIAHELQDQAARRPNLHLADFGAVLEEHPEYLLDDQVHFTDEGSQALAELMADTSRACR